jgi:DNA-binding transcriptional LysR family regulator
MPEADFRLFTAIVAAGTMQGAAQALGLTRSGVSKRLAQIEERLGVRLLNRTTRTMTLTDAGRAYHASSVRLLEEIDASEEAVRAFGKSAVGTLKLAASSMLAARFVIPLLREFKESNPDIHIQLHCSEEFSNVVGESIDLAIRIGRSPDSSLIARKLAVSRRVLCASPAYLERHGVPQRPEDLPRHNCLLLSPLGTSWNEWPLREGRHVRTLRVHGDLVLNSSHGHYESIYAGLGIGRVTELVARPDIESGRIRTVLDRYTPTDEAMISAIYPTSRHVSNKLRVFLDFLVKRFAAHAAEAGRGPGKRR